MNDEQDDPLAQDEQPSPLGYPTETPPSHHANRLPAQPRPALISQTQTTPQAPPAPPEPFTQADLIQMQRLQGALSTINKQVYSAEIEPEDGQDLKAQVHKQLGPLTQRQQATKQQAQQQAKQQMMDASALQESIEQTHAVKQAEGFPQTVASFTDPVTGRTEHFYQSKRGDWKPLEFAVATGEEERQAQQFDNTPDSGSTAPPMTAAAAPEPEGQQPLTMDQFGAQMKGQAPTGNSSSQPSPQILNQFGEQQQPGQSTRGERDEWGRPTGAAGQDTFAEMYRRADRAIPRLGPNATPAMHLHRQEQVAQLANRQLDRLTLAQEHREREKSLAAEHSRTEKAREAEHVRSEAAKSAEAQRKEQEKKAAEKKADTIKDDAAKLKNLHTHLGLIQKEYDSPNEKGTGKMYPMGQTLPPGKEYLTNDETMHAEAVRRTQRDQAFLHPPEAAKAGVAPKEEDDGLSPERAASPSLIPIQTVHDMMGKVTGALGAIPKDAGEDTPEGQLAGHLKGMQSILSRAHDLNQTLTVREQKKYETLQGKADAIIKGTGRSAGATGLQAAASPPVAAPGKQPEPPDANKLSHEDMTMVRNWMVSKGNHNESNVPALNKALALHDIAVPKDGSKGRDLTPEESKRYHDAQLLASRFYHRAKGVK